VGDWLMKINFRPLRDIDEESILIKMNFVLMAFRATPLVEDDKRSERDGG
jgi:hypothetical protein